MSISRNRDLTLGTVLLGLFFHFLTEFADSITFPVRLASLFSDGEYDSHLAERISFIYSTFLSVIAVILCVLFWTVLTGWRISEQGKHVELTELLKDNMKDNWMYFTPVIVLQQHYVRTLTFAHYIARSEMLLFGIPAFIKDSGGILFGIGCALYYILIFVFLSGKAERKALDKDCAVSDRICVVLLVLVLIMMLPMLAIILSGMPCGR